MFNLFKSRYIFKGTLELVSGLHIGGGKLSAATGSDSPVMKDYNGLPYIPGSSFKGVIRSALESLLRGLDNYPEFWSCDVVSGPSCVSDARKKELVESKSPNYEQTIFGESCTICRLFGSPFLGSKIFFKDLQVKPDTFSRIEVRDFVAIERDTETAKYQGKFDAEAVPSGTKFDFELVAENPEDYELGLLFAAFDMLDNGEIMLGGLTSRGLGRVQIKWDTITEKNIQSFLDGSEIIYQEKSKEIKSPAAEEPEPEEKKPVIQKPDTKDPLTMVKYAITKLEQTGTKRDSGSIGNILSNEFGLDRTARFQRKLPEKLADFLKTFIPKHLIEKNGEYRLADVAASVIQKEEKKASVSEEKPNVIPSIDELKEKMKDALLKKYNNSIKEKGA